MAIRRSPLCGIAVEAERVSSSRLWNTLRWTDSCTTPDFPINQISKRLNPAGQILCFPMEQDPVHQLVLRALRGSGVVAANPATIPKAIEKGEPITVTLPLSDEAAIGILKLGRKRLFRYPRQRVPRSKSLPRTYWTKGR